MTEAQHSLTEIDSDLEVSTDGASFAAIGELIGTSRESARSIVHKTLLKLRHHPELLEFNPHKKYGSL